MPDNSNESCETLPLGALVAQMYSNDELQTLGLVFLKIETPPQCPVNIGSTVTIGEIATLREVCDRLMDAYATAQVATETEGGKIQ